MNKQSQRTRMVSKDFAYIEIKQQIINGELQPGQSLVEETLTKELEISRTPLREALQRLEMEELVVRQSNGRLKVAPISKKEVEEIFVTRSLLEGLIAGQAAEKAEEKDVQNLLNVLKMINEASEKGDYQEIMHYGSEFHLCLYDISKNTITVKILSMLNDHILRYRRLFPKRGKDRSGKVIEEHALILNCIIAKDVKGAELAMQKHILSSLDTLIENIEQHE
ncbi:GntR family transcriptional regulator [Neobacillus niacini]|uniref:GntR family transcriptional regulator n=1 Tax=Neobacillus niacini TaxID=86668 RepID=UPI0007ABBE13|nr:GntR family transcriptional regulator [Neobacillus niacini]MEC1523859.1 GntR family transcriptional regulator [Neobacillus niacini]